MALTRARRQMALTIMAVALVLCGLWLADFVGRMQDDIDRHYIERDES